MATTQNTYTGNGSTTDYSFTFPYINTTDIKVSLDAVDTTAYTLSTATTIAFTTAPTNGAAIRIYRDTSGDSLPATFYPGSAIRSSDLNSNFTQNLYVTQEADRDVVISNTTANAAKANADTALTNSTNAVSTANAASATATTADTNASAAVVTANAANATANTAATDAANAVTTANAADANATTALNNSRASDGSGGYNTAISIANTALSNSTAAVSTANTADTNASTAVTTSNAATVTANNADTNATSALNIANAASAAISTVIAYTIYSNVAAIPSSPADGDSVEITDSTGIESFTPLSGLPSGYTGAAGLTARIRYDGTGSTWVWLNYYANNPETRYLKSSLPVVKGDSTNGSGQITLNCENNSHGVKIKGPAHSAAATYTLTLPDDTGTAGQFLKTDGSGLLSFATVDTAYIETPQVLTLNKSIGANMNAALIGDVAIGSGTTISIGQNSILKVLI